MFLQDSSSGVVWPVYSSHGNLSIDTPKRADWHRIRRRLAINRVSTDRQVNERNGLFSTVTWSDTTRMRSWQLIKTVLRVVRDDRWHPRDPGFL